MQILTKTGFQDFDGIQCNGWREDMLKFTFDDGTVIKCTSDHKFLLDNEESNENIFVEAYMLYEGVTLSGKMIVSIEESEPEFVYDPINVRNGNNYIANGVSQKNCDEFSFLPNSKEFWKATYPLIAKRQEARVIITSTPNGMGNEFYNQWENAQRGKSAFIPIRWFWNKVPGYDEAFKQETISNIGLQAWRNEFECEFLSTSETLVDGEVLQRLESVEPVKVYGSHCNVYEEPKDKHKYILSVDVADGVGKDYSVISIVDITIKPYILSAVYRNNSVSPFELDTIVVHWAKKYNNGFIVVETNNRGADVANRILYDHGYENLYIRDPLKPNGLGIDMKENIKRKGCVMLKNLIETNMIKITDSATINELRTFQITATGSYKGVNNMHDDTVMALVIFSIFTGMPIFQDLQGSDRDISQVIRDIKVADLPQDLLMDGFITNYNNPYGDMMGMSDLYFIADDNYDDINYYINDWG